MARKKSSTLKISPLVGARRPGDTFAAVARTVSSTVSIGWRKYAIAGRSCPRSSRRVAFQRASLRQSCGTPSGSFFHSTRYVCSLSILDDDHVLVLGARPRFLRPALLYQRLVHRRLVVLVVALNEARRFSFVHKLLHGPLKRPAADLRLDRVASDVPSNHPAALATSAAGHPTH